MRYRRLGKTGLRVSVVGIGTWQFGGEWGKDFTQDEVTAMFRRGEELGINLVDTAECYGDHLSEALVGGAITGRRDRWIVATKFGHKFHGKFDRSEPRSPADVQKQLENSLRALRTDYIDIYQYHTWGDDQFDDEGVLEVLRQAVKAGKVRHLGNSTGQSDKPDQTLKSAQRGIYVIQIVYNRLDRLPEKQVFEVCRQHDLGVLARVPLASGLLSGKYQPGTRFPEGDVRQRRDARWQDSVMEEVQQIARQEVPADVPMAHWALAWCLQHPALTCVIPGCKSVEQVESNAAAAELDMVRDDHPQALA